MKVLIAGSRHYPGRRDVEEFVRALPAEAELILPASPGPARWAEKTAAERGLKTLVIPTQARAGREESATTERNERLASELGPGDQAMLFLAIDPKRGGYSQTLKEIAQRARAQGAKVEATRPGRGSAPIEQVESMPFLHEEPTAPATLFDLFGEDPSRYALDKLR